jgi:hypothetical protein
VSESVKKIAESTDEISIDEFERWLDEFTPHQIVGRGSHAYSCPIACFLITQGYDTPAVRENMIAFGEYDYRSNRPRVTTPRWARRFVEKIDAHGGGNGGGIQARTARRILREVIEEVGDDIE